MIELKRILCPVDLSEFSRRALDHGNLFFFGSTTHHIVREAHCAC